MPTGPGRIRGAGFSKSYRDVGLQPFLGYYYSQGNFYLQGFEAINAPTDPNDVTLLFNDIGMGYYLYRNPNMDTFITAFAPTFEVHANVPLNHHDINNVNDPVGTATVVDPHLRRNVQFGQRTVLLLGAVTPVTGPRPTPSKPVSAQLLLRRPPGPASVDDGRELTPGTLLQVDSRPMRMVPVDVLLGRFDVVMLLELGRGQGSAGLGAGVAADRVASRGIPRRGQPVDQVLDVPQGVVLERVGGPPAPTNGVQ